jgi:hypothetical protein
MIDVDKMATNPSCFIIFDVFVAIINSSTGIPAFVIFVIAYLKQGTIPLGKFRIAIVSFIFPAANIKCYDAIINTLRRSWTIQEERE